MCEKFEMRPVPLQRLQVDFLAVEGAMGAKIATGTKAGEASKSASSQSISVSVVWLVIFMSYLSHVVGGLSRGWGKIVCFFFCRFAGVGCPPAVLEMCLLGELGERVNLSTPGALTKSSKPPASHFYQRLVAAVVFVAFRRSRRSGGRGG